MELLKSSRIYFADGIKDGYLVIDGKKIAGYLSKDTQVEHCIDYHDQRIIPGICDTHNHGTYGYGLDQYLGSPEATKQNIRNYLQALTFEGVTSALPTVTDTIKYVAEVKSEGYTGAAMLGIHSEGPYLSRVGEGGRPEPYPPVDLKFIQNLYDDSKGLLKLMAIAPEIPGVPAVETFLLSRGVKLAYAHSDLKAAGAREAVERGYRVSTHTANVMVGIHHRDIGGAGVMLMDPRIECEVICDGLHVSMDFIEMMFRIKDPSRFMMISDSATIAGIAPGRYEMGWVTPINVTPEGFVKDDDGRLMGSSKSVLYGIGNLVEKLHIPLEEVIKLSALNPCTYYGYGSQKGSIMVGKDADLVVISDDYHAQATYVEGTKVFDRSVKAPQFNPHPHFTIL